MDLPNELGKSISVGAIAVKDDRRRRKTHVYCALCLTKRPYLRKRHLGVLDSLFLCVMSLLVQYVYLEQQPFSCLYLAAILMAVSEIFFQLRWRVLMACPYCGFDPLLYLKRPDQATAKVKETVARK